MWRSSCTVNCVTTMCTLLITMLFISSANASMIPTLSSSVQSTQHRDQQIINNHHLPHHDDNMPPLPNSFSLIAPEGMLASFENTALLLRGKMHPRFHRVKREACKQRPDTEVMEYYDLKLPNRCWNDCDCRSGRYCTPFSWCHDLPKKP